MPPKRVEGNKELGKRIKERRNELKITIEEAALRAGVGTKTWSRYEAGNAIREDKIKGVCRALNWHSISSEFQEKGYNSLEDEFRTHDTWSKYLEEQFGKQAALEFAVGSDMLLDNIKHDMELLSKMPTGSHIGQIDSFLVDNLPQQFLLKYDYDFLFRLYLSLLRLQKLAQKDLPIVAHSVIDELLIYLCCDEASALVELECDKGYDENYWGWAFEMFDDADIVTFLYSDLFYLQEDNEYHFVHWWNQQFFIDNESNL